MSIAQTIIDQLGGNKFVAMTGAKNFVADDRSVAFSIGRNASKINRVMIVLENDEYNVLFYNARGFEARTIKTVDGVQASQLRDVFANATGMAVSL